MTARPFIAAILASAVALGATPASAAPRGDAAESAVDGEWIEFFGWSPRSDSYGYRVVSRAHDRAGEVREAVEERLVSVPATGRPAIGRPDGGISRHAARHRFVARPCPSERVDGRTVRFLLGPEAYLVVRTVVGQQLRYRVTLEVSGRERPVGAGTYDDIYLETDAHAFVSPDGRKVALIVYGEAPYRVRGEVHFMRLPSYPRGESPAG